MPQKFLKKSEDSVLASRIRESLGVGPTEDVETVTPQFERLPDDPSPPGFPGKDVLKGLPSQSPGMLRELGLRPWNDPNDPEDAGVTRRIGGTLWLFPGEWYHYIPDGFVVTDISGCQEWFESGTTDDDIRFGCLAYGIVVPNYVNSTRLLIIA